MEATGVVQEAGRVNANSADGIKMTENITITETLEKIGGLGFDSRDRRKSKYLSYPYINTGPRHKGLPVETEDLSSPCLSHKVEGTRIATNHLNGSPSFAKLGSKRFRKNWYRKLNSWSTMTSSTEFLNASSYDLLSGLHSKAVDCMFPIEGKGFDLVEGFFCMFRLSEYHDEAELAASLVNLKGGNIGKPVGNDLFDIKTEKKRRKNNKKENAVKHKTKSLSRLSDVNVSTSTEDFQLKDWIELNTRRPGGKMKQKIKVEEVTSLHQLQNDETTSNGGSTKSNIVPDGSHPASEEKVRPKKRKIAAPLEHQSAQIAQMNTNAKSNKSCSLVIDLQLVSPSKPGGIPEKSNTDNKEELVQIGLNADLSVSQEGFVGSIANHSPLMSATSEAAIVNAQKIGKEKAEEHLNTEFATRIPDLNGTSCEFNSIRKEFENVNGLSPELNSKYEKSNKTTHKSEQSRSLSAGTTPFKTISFSRVEANGEELGTCLLLQFAPGVPVPSKDDLLATFCRFGPLNESETKSLKETGSAEIVFVRGTDAGEAFRCLEQNKPFGATLVSHTLRHLSATCPPVDRFVTSLPASVAKMPADTPPPLNFIRQNLQMMTAMLENSGNNLSPEMRAKLDGEIKTLMRKVNSMPCSFSTDV